MLTIATDLGVANGTPVTPLPIGAGAPCSAFQVLMWDDGAFQAKLQISPDGGTTWIDYTDADLTATGMIESVFIGEGVKARLVNASGTVSAVLVPLP